MKAAIINTLWMLALIVLSALVYVRVAPTSPANWHIDPMVAASPGPAGILVRPRGGDIEPRNYDMPPGDLLRRLDRIIRSTARTRVLAGSVEEGRITYVTRSLVFGFPDYATVTTVPTGTGSAPVILSRLRFGLSDSGVNRARVTRWLKALDQAG